MKHLLKKGAALLLTLSMICSGASMNIAANTTKDIQDEPLLTVAFMSDLHNQQTVLESGNIRGSIEEVCDQLAEEDPDVLVIGGDVTSDSYVDEETLKTVLDKVQDQTSKVTDQVLWITGNHDYNAGERDGYNSAPYYEYIMKNGIGELSEEDSYYEDYNGGPELLAYHYVIQGFDFLAINTSHTDLYGSKQNTNYAYSEGAMEWIGQKLEEIGKEKTVFIIGHFPFRDSNSLSSASKGMTEASDQKFKSILSQYPNAIYFYGHDHATDSAYIHTDTSQRTTQYLADGTAMRENMQIDENVIWEITETADGYTIKNLVNDGYLGLNGNLNTISEEAFWEITQNDGYFTMKEKSSGRSLHIGTGNKFSAGAASQVSLYKKEGDRYLNIDTIESGKQYVITCSAGEGTYALTNQTNGASGESIRMEPLEVEKNGNEISSITLADPSFISTFMGSLRYYNNSIETGPTVENSKVVQTLMMYVYADRIELKMVNRGEQDGGSWDIQSYIIERDIIEQDDEMASDAAIQALRNMVDKAVVLGSDDAALNAAIEAAQAVLAKKTPTATEVVTALLDLSEAMQALNMDESTDALRADVQATIDFINENILNNVEGLRPGKVQALKDAVQAAQTLVNNPDATVDELKAANKAMTKAAQELWEIVTKAELEALIEAANGYLDGDYTAESLEALQAAIEAAQAVAANDDATTAEVTEAITNLSSAIAGLESITLDTSALEYEINLVNEMLANLDNYVPSSVEGLDDKLADAQNVLENAASQAEIDEATKTLREARLSARTKADVSALEELIAYAKSLDLSGYTKESVQVLVQNLACAEGMTNDPEITQEEVDNMVKELQASVDNLVEVNNSTSAEESTNTAAVMQTGMFAILLAGAAGVLYAARRRRDVK